MKSSTEELVRRVQAAKKLWDELKARWGELKLPGSAYMPSEVMTLLMLADVEGDAPAVAERIRAAADRLAELKRDSRTSFLLLGSDASAIFALISADGIITSEPEPVVLVPGSDSRDGNNLVMPASEPASSLHEGTPAATSCPHCGHGFDACAAGEYRRPATPPPADVAPLRSDAPDAFDPCVHVDAHGRCTECTKDETVECTDCGNAIVESRGYACKNYGTHRGDCGNIYCDDCKPNLGDHGYCPDCATIQCSGCEDDFDTFTERTCSNQQCREELAYCEGCANDLLNVQGLCTACSKEDEVECDSCGQNFTESRVTFCVTEGCDACFCAAHVNNLDQKGLCADCA